MKVGSLVVLKKDIVFDEDVKIFIELGGILPIKGIVYTVRGFNIGFYGEGVYLEEIVNPPMKTTYGIFVELALRKEFYKEIQPPMDIKIEDFIVEKQTV